MAFHFPFLFHDIGWTEVMINPTSLIDAEFVIYLLDKTIARCITCSLRSIKHARTTSLCLILNFGIAEGFVIGS